MSQTTLTPDIQAQLEQLKDIHLPAPISWWPLAIGWWILIAIALISFIAGIWWWFKKSSRLKKSVLAELHGLPSDNPILFISELSALLRRVAIYRYGQAYSVHNLSGQKWANFLNQGDKGIAMPLANMIANAPYSNNVSSGFDANALRQEAERWIVHQLKRGKK
ncbi:MULTISPECIES: DUF4381 domain-containing protein [Pasteurellaceae]|uniref:DUF4381 domain-containing protein n=1 Tax=Pasteurella atlantica TaxID=2827233 RepID=A0AAW8CCT1_9PAST|nr:DUF4381 domain-containing protein [Pasteurella atlantica]MBR0572632.1 DUF4381 domain-containing protein [Pasteurella atlantica]MDP8038578.1 DUF4381 domain-containing protein [Pasteurella atlantica]MDP8040670.1 DUF4381 domain-containing protein [Pasteurella atlantica]MDP8042805.1 DUF4381 domain-containing protein [Pasteurella atlantica]MDP8044892.1 DUF4381 domain-containing protein [Pasteurella atlantica]